MVDASPRSIRAGPLMGLTSDFGFLAPFIAPISMVHPLGTPSVLRFGKFAVLAMLANQIYTMRATPQFFSGVRSCRLGPSLALCPRRWQNSSLSPMMLGLVGFRPTARQTLKEGHIGNDWRKVG